MYNGIGLQTTRGTGTNGYVTRNLSFVRVSKEKVEYKPDEELKKLETYINKKGNAELLKHDRKRKIEIKCVEMEEMMSEEGYPEEEIKRKVDKFRKQMLEKDSQKADSEINLELNEFGKPVEGNTHKQAEANDMKNRKLREAFGLGEFDPSVRAKQIEEERRLKAETEKEMRQKRYQWVDQDDVSDNLGEQYNKTVQNRQMASQSNVADKQEQQQKKVVEELPTPPKNKTKVDKNAAEKPTKKSTKNMKNKSKKTKKAQSSSSSSSDDSDNSDSSSSSSDSSNSSSSDSQEDAKHKTKRKTKKNLAALLAKRKRQNKDDGHGQSSDEEHKSNDRKRSNLAKNQHQKQLEDERQQKAYQRPNVERPDRNRSRERERRNEITDVLQSKLQASEKNRYDRSEDRNRNEKYYSKEARHRESPPPKNSKMSKENEKERETREKNRARMPSKSPPPLRNSSKHETEQHSNSKRSMPKNGEKERKRSQSPKRKSIVDELSKKRAKSSTSSDSSDSNSEQSNGSFYSSSDSDAPPRKMLSTVIKK